MHPPTRDYNFCNFILLDFNPHIKSNKLSYSLGEYLKAE